MGLLPSVKHLLSHAIPLLCFSFPPHSTHPPHPQQKHQRSAGAVLRDLVITGCPDSAIHLLQDPSQEDSAGRYPENRPVQFETVTLTGNPGAAIRMDNGTAAALFDSAIDRNTAPGGTIVAGAGTLLNLTDTRLVGNNGSAVNFTGVTLFANRCNFTGNAASDGAGLWSAFVNPPADLYATEGTGTVVPPTGKVIINGCRFEGNKAKNGGGGIYIGNRMFAFVTSSVFRGNAALEGGGAHAARDGCLEVIDRSQFIANGAGTLGGGLLTRAPLCSRTNMTWSGLVVSDNTANGDGGGVYLSEAAYRWLHIRDSAFSRNRAAGAAPAGRSGDGGALYLGTWSSRVWLNGTVLAGNTAARSGGGVHAIMLSQDNEVDLTVTRSNATGNRAGGAAADASSEGGALRVLGSFAVVEVGGSSFTNNSAGQGGAISFGADRGSISIGAGTNFSDNRALIAGGGVLVGESADAAVTKSTFSDNTASSQQLTNVREAAVGGGFCCYRCNSVRIVGCTFANNHAGMYGGGAAVLQPYSNALITGSHFDDNSAALPVAVTRRRKLAEALAAASVQCGPNGECKSANAGFKLAAWATTVDVSNTTADDGNYGGGGGLYLSLRGAVNMSDTHFTSNQAESGGAFCLCEGEGGNVAKSALLCTSTALYAPKLTLHQPANTHKHTGGMIVRTDLCPPNSPTCKITLSGRNNSFLCNSADGGGAGGGLLFTKLSSGLVDLGADCGKEVDLKAFRECLAAAGALPPCVAAIRRPGAGRALLQDAVAFNRIAPSGYGEDLASAATSAHFLMVDNATVDALPLVYNASAAPGNMLPINLLLRDHLGNNVTGKISDASMIMQVRLGLGWGGCF